MLKVPYKKFTVLSPRSPSEVREILASHTGKAPFVQFRGVLSSLAGTDPDPYFYGSVAETGFSIHRHITYRNSFVPYLKGSIIGAENDGMTRVQITSALHSFIAVFMGIWMTGAVIAAVCGLGIVITQKRFDPLPFIFLPFGYFLTVIPFSIEQSKAEQKLCELLDGRIEDE